MSDSDQSARRAQGLSLEALRFLDSGSLPVRGPAPDSKPSAGEQDLLSGACRSAQSLTDDLDHFTDTLRALVMAANEASSRVGSLRRTHLELRADLDRAQAVMADREQLASTLANRLSELAAELALQQGQWKDQETEIAEAHARTEAALRAELAELDAKRSELAAALETERAEKAALGARITELEAEFEAERARAEAAFEARLGQAKAEVAQALVQVAKADAERAFALEEQERFVKSVVDEYEQKLRALQRSRDEAIERAAAGAPTLQFAISPSAASDQLVQRVRELEEQLEQIQHERELSREVIRRLQLGRDEAQETAARLTRELEALKRAAETGAPAAVPAVRKSANAPTLPDLPRPSVPAAAAVAGAAGGPETMDTLPPPPRPPEAERAPAPSTPRSALAAALAASDPMHRRRQAEALEPAGADKAPLKSKPGWSTRPLVGYSKRDVEPDDVRPKPPRRHGG